MTDQPLRVGLLVNGESTQAWAKTALERMVAETNVEITHVVVNEYPPSFGMGHYLNRVREYPLWSPIGGLHLLADEPSYSQQVTITDIDGIGNAEWIACKPEPAPDFGTVLPEEVVERVGPEIDVAIRLGFGILKGAFLDAPEHGVLSFHHGDLRRYRGQPAGFWEFVNGETVAGVTLQRITETLDGGSVVAYRSVDIADAHTWKDVEQRLYDASKDMLAMGIENITDPEFEPWKPETYGDLYSLPTGQAVFTYLAKNTLGRVRKLLS